MTKSATKPPDRSYNGTIGAIAFAAAAFLTLLLTHASEPLSPMRLLVLALVTFAVWSFCEEMGLHKPLNRVGFVFFAIAVAAKVQIVLGVAAEFSGRYHLLYAAFLLLALLFWSAAFLHRERSLKVIGAAGLLASLAPIILLVVGHIGLGAGAVLGIGALLSAAGGAAAGDLGFVTLVERIFGMWGYVAAWFLWRGHIRFAPRLQ
jgi:hypothetical protein